MGSVWECVWGGSGHTFVLGPNFRSVWKIAFGTACRGTVLDEKCIFPARWRIRRAEIQKLSGKPNFKKLIKSVWAFKTCCFAFLFENDMFLFENDMSLFERDVLLSENDMLLFGNDERKKAQVDKRNFNT